MRERNGGKRQHCTVKQESLVKFVVLATNDLLRYENNHGVGSVKCSTELAHSQNTCAFTYRM